MYFRRVTVQVCSFAFLLGLCSGKIEESFSRCETSNGRETCTYSDGDTVVTLFFASPGNNLLECNVQEENSTISRQLLKEAVVANRKDGVRFNMLDMDVKKLARKCRKYIRDTRRKAEDLLTLNEELMLRRLSLDEPLLGTKFCSRKPVKSHQVLGDDENLDMCCKDFHSCSEFYIAPFTFQHGVLNNLPWPVVACSCVTQFRRCLLNEGSTKALRFDENLLQVVHLPCVAVDTRNVCVEYDPWLNQCVRTTEQTVVIDVQQVL